MAAITALDKDAHRDLRVDNHPSERYGDNVGMIGVVPREFGRLVAHYPIFFRRTPKDDGYECGAMMGFSNTENLFITDARWDALYVPLNIQRQPFVVIARASDASGQLAVAFDPDHPRLIKDGGEALFLADGNPTEYMQRVTAALTEMVQGAVAGSDYTGKLDKLGLIEKVRVDVEFVDRSRVTLDGLYSINREKLQALKPKPLAELRDLGYLEWIYFQLASLSHVNGLVSRKNRRLAGL